MRNLALSILSCAILTGCAGYKLGSSLPDDIETVFVPTVVNASKEPLLETALTPALQSEVMTYSGVKLVTSNNADARLEVRVTDYSLHSIGFTSDDDESSRAREYRAWLKADVLLKNVKTGEIISSAEDIRAKTTFILEDLSGQGDIVGAKRASMQRACQELAREVLDSVMEVWE